MMRWLTASVGFTVSLGLAFAAYAYVPPPAAYARMLSELLSQPLWHIHLEGILGNLPLQADLVQERGARSLLRLSYPPLKLINNQWIELGSAEELFTIMQFTRRLPSVDHEGRHLNRYAFELQGEAFAPYASGFKGGEIWLDHESGLPARLTFDGSEVPDASKLDARVSYVNPFGESEISSRPLDEVIAQLHAFAQAKNGKPNTLPSLADEHDNREAFVSDFDHDGLTDALEVFYHTDPANPDTDNDRFLDGAEVVEGYNPAGEGTLSTN